MVVPDCLTVTDKAWDVLACPDDGVGFYPAFLFSFLRITASPFKNILKQGNRSRIHYVKPFELWAAQPAVR